MIKIDRHTHSEQRASSEPFGVIAAKVQAHELSYETAKISGIADVDVPGADCILLITEV